MKNQAYQIISILAITASFIPLGIVFFKKLWRERAFLLIAVYWAISGMVNMIDRIPGVSSRALDIITMVYNMLDIPLILLIIYYTTSSPSLKKFALVTSPSLLIIQLMNFLLKGWNYDSAKYVLAAGLAVVLAAVVWEISLYMQKLEHTRHEKAMVFIHVSLLFAYGTFIIVYIFDYYINTTGSSTENLIVYYVSTFIAIMIASVGYLAKSSKKNFI